jgi:hypothetical protein
VRLVILRIETGKEQPTAPRAVSARDDTMWPLERAAAALALHDARRSNKEIGRILGVVKDEIRRWLRLQRERPDPPELTAVQGTMRG